MSTNNAAKGKLDKEATEAMGNTKRKYHLLAATQGTIKRRMEKRKSAQPN